MSDTKTQDAREHLDEVSARVIELESQLAAVRAQEDEAQRKFQQASAEDAMPKVESRKRKKDYELEVKGPRPVDLPDRQLIPGDKVKASELQEVMGEHALTRLLMMGWFKVVDKDFEQTRYGTDELRGDEAAAISTGLPFERPPVVSVTEEQQTAQWESEAAILERIRKGNEEQGVKDNHQRILDQQTAEVARFADAQAALRVDDQGRAPEPGVALTAEGGPVVEDGAIVNAEKFPTPEHPAEDLFVAADDDDDEHHEGTPADPQTPEEQRFDAAAVDDMTVAEVKDYVDTFPAERREEVLMKVLDVESAGKNRSTLIAWIEEEVGE